MRCWPKHFFLPEQKKMFQDFFFLFLLVLKLQLCRWDLVNVCGNQVSCCWSYCCYCPQLLPLSKHTDQLLSKEITTLLGPLQYSRSFFEKILKLNWLKRGWASICNLSKQKFYLKVVSQKSALEKKWILTPLIKIQLPWEGINTVISWRLDEIW